MLGVREAQTKARVISASRLVDDVDACKRATEYIQKGGGTWMIEPRRALLTYQSVMAT